MGRPRPVDLRIEDGRIVAVGDAGGAAGRVIAADGLWLLPGFCESHLHLFWGGLTLDQLNLAAVHSAAAFRDAVEAFAAGRPGDGWLCVYAANYDLLGAGTRPDRRALDAVVPSRPFVIMATDGHAAWANTLALERAGLMDRVPELANAEVVLGPDGLPNGELREGAACQLVMERTPGGGRDGLGLTGSEPLSPPTDAERAHDRAAILRALGACAANGITTAVNMDGNAYQADLFTDLAEAGALPIRVSLPMTIGPDADDARVEALLDIAARPPVGRLSFGRVKMFMDGVFDTWTAFRTDDYPDRPGFRGEALFSAARFNDICARADARGLTIAVHAVGDGAVRRVIDGYDHAIRTNGARDARHRIEHIDMLHPDDRARIAALGIVASMQPVHPPGSSGLPLEPTVSIMGPHRWGDTFPWRALRDAGVWLAFGTDWPVSPLSPMNAIHSALSRRIWAEGLPDQRLPLDEVLAAYATGGAYALHDEDRRGRIAPGMEADLVLIDGDPAGLADSVDACRVRMTICQGRPIYEEEA